MELEFRKDFPEVKQRWADFWDGKLACPLLQIEVPRPGCTPVSKHYPVRPDRNEQTCIDQVLAWAETHEFLGDAVPWYTVEFAAAHFALLLGAELEYHDTYDETGWVKPFVTEWDETELQFQRDGHYWKRTVEILQAFRARCDGKLMVSAPVLSAGLDALAAVRGTQQLLMDLIECPNKILRAQEQVCLAYGEIVEELSLILGWDALGTTNWLGLYHPGRMNMLQCDFSTMISPDMFRRFELPFLQALAGFYNDFAYHLDGPEEIKHLEAIGSLRGLKAIQYVPVARDNEADIDTLYRRICSLGVGVWRSAKLHDVKRYWKEYSRNRCIFGVIDVAGRDEARRLVDSFDSSQGQG